MLPVVQVGNICADLLGVALYEVLNLEAHTVGLEQRLVKWTLDKVNFFELF